MRSKEEIQRTIDLLSDVVNDLHVLRDDLHREAKKVRKKMKKIAKEELRKYWWL